MKKLLHKDIPESIQKELEKLEIKELRPSQYKAIDAGLFSGKNLLVCTPTASGKTLVGELGILHCLEQAKKQKKNAKAIYVVPLRALANEKYKDFRKRHPNYKVTLTSGEMDNDDRYLSEYDIIITTSEKLDSLIRHHSPWLKDLRIVIIDEVHLLNDIGRGPTLEILITILRNQIKQLQVIALSATIGNAKELADWLDAKLVEDSWRPVRLDKGVFHEDTIYFEK